MPAPLIQCPGSIDVDAPIIIIGAGRSGSTFLMRLLDAQPALSVRGETRFLAARLWREIWDDDFWRFWREYVAMSPTSSQETLPPRDPGETERLQRMIGRTVAMTVMQVLEIDPDAAMWGFKEVWNGSGGTDFDWLPYDWIFPKAHWIHVVRHPFDFVGSCLAWNAREHSIENAQSALSDWLSIFGRSRQRATCDRYFEIRYEDLCRDPAETLAPLLESFSIDTCEMDRKMAAEALLKSQRDRSAETRVLSALDVSREVVETAGKLGYDLANWPPDDCSSVAIRDHGNG